MFDFLVYLAESALCLAALYLIYKVAMSNETLHRLNRVLLLGSVVLSAVLPLCRLKIIREYDPVPITEPLGLEEFAVAEAVEVGIDYVSLLKDLAVVVFILGVAFMLVRLAVGIYSVWRLIHSGEMSVIEEDVTLTVVSQLSSPFSWFGHIVASQSDVQEYRRMILSHELAHIRLRHSWDVMAVDLALCLWWFNPAMWLLRRELQSLHEYQADDAVLRDGVDAKTYQMLLIKRAVGSRLHSVANCLNHSNLKNRITMMCKKTSSRWAATKALLVVPMVAVAMGAFATTVYVPREVQDKVTENSVNNKEYKPAIIEIKGSDIYLNNKRVTAAELEAVIEEYRLQTLIYDENDAASKRTYEAIHNTLKRNGNIDAIYANGKRPEISNVRIADGKIYLNDEQVTIEQLKAKADENPATLINLQADADTSMGMVADVKNAFRSTSHAVKVNYYKEDKPQPIYIVDGKVIPIEDVNKIDANTFSSVVVYKSYKDEFSKYGITEEQAKNGVVVIELKKEGEVNTAQSETKSADIKVVGYSTRAKDSAQQQKDLAYIKVEKMPTFQGGDLNAFRNWVQGQIQYPKEAMEKNISGRVIFSFVVEKDGSTSDFTVLQTPDKLLADEVERIFKSCPKWEPGTQRGEKVRVKYTVPIVFAVQGGDTASSESLKAFNLAMAQIQKGDALEKEMNGRNYKDAAEQKADQQKVNDCYRSAVGFLETAYQLDSKHKPTIQALQLATFRLRDEAGMMAKYEKYKAALEAL
ncbi:MAG: energy transducer TonB [Alistipes sp.]|nr:energy transducer TonB [Alistipes sp.]